MSVKPEGLLEDIKTANVFQYLAVLMSVKPEGLLEDIKTANVFHHQVKAKNLNCSTYIYILYY